MQTKIDWDDLRYVLAVAEAGSLAAAARTLGVNHTTVLRRVNGFEERLGLRLFDRLPGGYALTAGGEEWLAAARGMAETVADLERRLTGQDLRLEGELRLTTTDTLMIALLAPILAEFRAVHPGIALEVTTGNAYANLTRRDADVAIRPTAEPPENLVGRRVGAVPFAIYARRPASLGEACGPIDPAALAGEPWIGLDASLAGSTVERWMRVTIPAARVALRCDTMVAARAAAEAGIGLAALPCYLGDAAPGLVRRSEPVPEMATALWVLTHEDLRRTARVSAFTEFVSAALATSLRRLAERR